MNRFAALLKRIDETLDIPQPSRSRVILEISADMEDLYDHYVGQGLDEPQAMDKTIEDFDLSPEAVAAIAEIHDSPLRRFLDRFSGRTRSTLEKTALALATIPVIYIGLRLAQTGGMSRDSGVWIWPLLAGTVAALALGVSKWYGLYVVKEHNVRAVRKRLDAALYIALGQLSIGFLGMYVDLFQTWVNASADKEMTIVYLAHWLQRSSALLSTSMIAALVSGLIWIANSGKAASIEQYESELILDSQGEIE
jgi:hypothetical protein